MKWWMLVLAVLVLLIAGDGSEGQNVALVLLAGVAGWGLQRLRSRVQDLEARLQALQQVATEAGAPHAAAQPTAEAPEVVPAPAQPSLPLQVHTDDAVAAAPMRPDAPALAEPPSPRPASPVAPPTAATTVHHGDDRATDITSSIGQSLRAWFQGGNTIVRLGVVILFFGVAFLLRFAAEHALLPIELRLAGVALGGLALTVVGWRLRERRRGYGLSLQGAGIGVLYLVVFAALRLYALLPPPLAFGLLVALAVLGAVLAMRQDALALAVLAFGGGFLAPVLTSTGQGSHVALFSYYLVLNLAIAWIASKRAWKLLNLVGFGFTFVIGTAWGLRAYQPEMYLSTQLFLALHFALYLFISVQYGRQLVAARDEARLRAVDGGLLFGLPIVTFGLQAGLVKHLPFGLALSAAALSAVYLLLGRWLWRQAGPALKLLTEGLLALGLIFLVLVTPLALDGRWTAAAWGVQGAGILWVALRQQRGWAAAIGLGVQAMAAATFWQLDRPQDTRLLWNAELFGALLLGAAALFSARLLQRGEQMPALPWPGAARPVPPQLLKALHLALLALGVVQWVSGWLNEVLLLPAPALDADARTVLVFVVHALLAEGLQRRWQWPQLGAAGRVLVALAAVVSLNGVLDSSGSLQRVQDRFALNFGWLEWLAVLGSGVWLQRRLAQDSGFWRRSLGAEHLLLGWYAVIQAAVQLYALVGTQIARHESWTALALIVGPCALVGWLARQLRLGRWPAAAHPRAWRLGLILPWIGLLALWCLVVDVFSDGGMAPLPYLPLLNPVDLGHVLALLLAVHLWRAGLLATRPLLLGTAAVGFVWLNAVLVRTLHHWVSTPMWTDGGLHHGVVQTGFTILWTVLALLTMLFATRRAPAAAARRLWMVGAALLGVVVLKLFFVDLSSVGTLERIVSFLGVGLLMLVIGYVSPMPPAATAVPSDPKASA